MRNYRTLAITLLSCLLVFFSTRSYADLQPVTATPQFFYPTVNTVAGNPHGKVTVIEFFDYRCFYCHQMPPILAELLRSNPQVRLVYRDYPMLGPASLYAARAALAAGNQGKYLALHNALFNSQRPLSKSSVMALASSIGINTTQLAQDMGSDAVNQQLDANAAFAEGVGIVGVPTVVIGATPDSTHAGSTTAFLILSPSLEEMQQAIAKVS